LSKEEVSQYPRALQPLAAEFARMTDSGPINRDWRNWEKRLHGCATDYALTQFLESQVFAALEARNRRDDNTSQAPVGKVSFSSVADYYPRILQKAMNLLRVQFRNPLAAHTLFQRAKTLSAESYVLGCTTGAYSEWMLVRWKEFRDLGSVVEILEEMGVNGIPGDEKTLRIIDGIVRDVEEWASIGPEAIKPLWSGERERLGRLEKIQREIRGQMHRQLEETEEQKNKANIVEPDDNASMVKLDDRMIRQSV
jgi:hypothetical protein